MIDPDKIKWNRKTARNWRWWVAFPVMFVMSPLAAIVLLGRYVDRVFGPCVHALAEWIFRGDDEDEK